MNLFHKIFPQKLLNPKFIFITFFILYVLTIFVKRPPGLSITNGDEPHYLIMTYSMLYDGDLDIVNNYKNYSYHSWYTVPYLTEHTFPLNNKKYALHQIGLSAYILPAFAIAGRNGAAIFMALLSSFALINTYKILQFFVSKKIASLTTWISGLSVPIFVYSILIYPEVVLFFLISWILLIIVNPRFILNKKNAALLILLIALIPPLHIKFLVIIGIILLYINIIQFKKIKLQNLIIFDVIASIGSLLYLIWMYFWFEGRFAEAMYFIAAKNKFLLEYIPSGLLGSLVDRESGFLLFAPIYVYLIIGFRYFLKNVRTMNFHTKVTRLFIVILILVQTIFVTMYPHIISGQNPAGRYFLPIFPALVILLAFALETLLTYKLQRIIIVIMLIYTLIITTIFAFNPILALPFSNESNLVNFIFKTNAPMIHQLLPNLSKFDRIITVDDYVKGYAIFAILLLLSYSHILFRQKPEGKIKKKISKKEL